jgi:lipoprotein-anchoring transpeptidase ErfK/SrfK
MKKTMPVLAILATVSLFGLASRAQAQTDAYAYFPAPASNATQVAPAQDPALGREYPLQTRVLVDDPTGARVGDITIDTANHYLYLSLGQNQAIRYDVGVGRDGFLWKGQANVARKAEWPSWTPPQDMLKRRPDLPRHMVGGIDNPLGARAMYLYQGNRDTMFRIHGSNEPWTIGQAVSSGCIRMTNDDVEDLYERVRLGARVNVL